MLVPTPIPKLLGFFKLAFGLILGVAAELLPEKGFISDDETILNSNFGKSSAIELEGRITGDDCADLWWLGLSKTLLFLGFVGYIFGVEFNDIRVAGVATDGSLDLLLSD